MKRPDRGVSFYRIADWGGDGIQPATTMPLLNRGTAGTAGRAICAPGMLAHEAVYRRPHLIEVREIPVDGREANVRHQIEVVQPLDDEFTDRRARHLALPEIEERALDIRH